MSSSEEMAATLWPDMAKAVATAPASASAKAAPVARATPPPSGEKALTDTERAAAMWPEMFEEKPEPQRRIVARSDAAIRPEEKLFGAAMEDAEAAAEGDADAAEPVVDVLEITPGLEIVAPEGFEEYSVEALNVFAPIVERSSMIKADVQQLVDLHAKAIQETVENVNQGNLERLEQLERQWQQEARSDPELLRGGFDANVSKAKSVLKQFAPKGLAADLKMHALTNNPHLIKFLLRVHGAIHHGQMKRYGRRG